MINSDYPVENIFITDGDDVKKITNVSELITILSEGGSTKWIPIKSAKLVRKLITKPGNYKASDEPGHPYGYSEVTIAKPNGSPDYVVGIKAITENGVYYPSEETGNPYYVYSTVIVDVPGGV